MTERNTRERLLRAAQEIIAADGWAAATTRNVAQRAGVNQGLVHYHVGSIHTLRREATLQGIRAFFAEAVARRPTDRDGLLPWLSAQIDAGVEERPALSQGTDAERRMLTGLLHESLTASARDDLLREAIASLIDEYRVQLADTLASCGIAEPEEGAALIAAAVDGAILHRALQPQFDSTLIVQSLARTLGLA